MSIRSRIGDFLFRALFPDQAERLEAMEDELIDASISNVRANAAVSDARRAIEETRKVLDDTRDLVARLTGPDV